MTFRLLGFPVEIQQGALLLAGIVVLFGLSRGTSPVMMAGTIAIGAVSILVHELGHASAARGFGLRPVRIALHGFGGTTTHPWSGSSAKELVITVMGPLFGFGLAIAAGLSLLFPVGGAARDLLWLAMALNLGWSVFNLLPIFPMDGGRALGFALCTVLPERPSWLFTHALGVLLGAGLAIWAMASGDLWIAMFGGMFAWQNVQGVQAAWAAGEPRRPARDGGEGAPPGAPG